MSTWTHESVYEALKALRGESTTANRKVKFYDHPTDAAVLYQPNSKDYSTCPVHLNPGRKGWDSEFYRQVWSYLDMTVRKQPDSNGYLVCAVKPGGWDVIANALKLKAPQ